MRKRKYTCDDHCFDQLTEQSLYWIGMLTTDGNVRKRGNSSGVIKLKLESKDKEHIEKFKKFLKTDAPIHNTTSKKFYPHLNELREYKQSVLEISSEPIYNRLNNLNIVPNKTFIYSIPEEIKNHKLINHFMRGCIDGDGWIYNHKDKRCNSQAIIIGFCGASSLVYDIFNKLKSKCNLEDVGYFKKINNTFRFEISGHHDVNKIIDYLYKDATIYLERKHIVAKLIKDIANNSNSFGLNREELLKAYSEEKTVQKTSKRLNISSLIIKKYLLKYNIPINKYKGAKLVSELIAINY